MHDADVRGCACAIALHAGESLGAGRVHDADVRGCACAIALHAGGSALVEDVHPLVNGPVVDFFPHDPCALASAQIMLLLYVGLYIIIIIILIIIIITKQNLGI